jgi:UDP-N-acetylmuramyl pentapeptide synthase
MIKYELSELFRALISSEGVDEKRGMRIVHEYYGNVVYNGNPNTVMERTMDYIQDLPPREILVIGNLMALGLVTGMMEETSNED